MIAAIGDQATDIQGRLNPFVAAHGAVAFFDPPADGAFGGVVGAIQDFATGRVFPVPVKGQTRPAIPAIQEEVAQAISQAGRFPFWGGFLLLDSVDTRLRVHHALPVGGGGSILSGVVSPAGLVR